MNPPRVIRQQRQRTKGWRAPAGAIYCSRPGRFGNPFPAASSDLPDRAAAIVAFKLWLPHLPEFLTAFSAAVDAAIAEHGAPAVALCWCPDDVCHVMTLIEADAEARR